MFQNIVITLRFSVIATQGSNLNDYDANKEIATLRDASNVVPPTFGS
jgi:hypothetical protein